MRKGLDAMIRGEILERVAMNGSLELDLGSPAEARKARARYYAWAARNPNAPPLRVTIEGEGRVRFSPRSLDRLRAALAAAPDGGEAREAA